MTKKNFLLLIIFIIFLTGISMFFLSLNKPTGVVSNNPAGSGTNFVSDFFNIIKKTTTSDPNNQEGNTTNEGNTNTDGSSVPLNSETLRKRLVMVSSMPVAGFGLFNKERFRETQETIPTSIKDLKTTTPSAPGVEKALAVRYIERKTGNIYQSFVDKIDERKFSNTLIPNVEEAYFGNNASSIVLRYLKTDGKTIATYTGALPKEVLGADSTNTSDLVGTFLPENITDLSVSPDTSKIFYIHNLKDAAIGVISTFSGENKTQVLNSNFTQWLSWWPSDNMLTVTTKPANGVPGYMYKISTSRKDLRKTLGNINGLMTLTSPDGKLVLYNNDNLALNIYNTETMESASLNVRTLVDKCVFAKSGEYVYCGVPKNASYYSSYPDSWYMGEASLSDSFWKINTKTNEEVFVLDPITVDNSFNVDTTKPSIDEDENYLFFINKNDSYLWKLELR